MRIVSALRFPNPLRNIIMSVCLLWIALTLAIGNNSLLFNASFEAGLEGWSASTGAARLSSSASDGIRGIRVDGVNAGVTQEMAADPQQSFRLTAKARRTGSAERAYVGILFRDRNGENIPGSSSAARVESSTYSAYGVTGKAPANARSVVVFAWKEAQSGVLFADDFVLTSENAVDADPQLADFGTLKVLQIQANMVVDTAEELLQRVDRAINSGANAVLFSDSKINRAPFSLNGERWRSELQAFYNGIQAREVSFFVNTVTMGYCGAIINDNLNLATGYPVIDQPLGVRGNRLIPQRTATLPNGGFEEYTGDQAIQWQLQDAPGQRTFIDTSIKRSGNVALRADARNGEMSRVGTRFTVKPFHQYTIRVWLRTRNLTADNLLLVLRDQNNLERNLSNQHFSTGGDNGLRRYFNRPVDLNLDWTEMRIAFNSLDATEVNLGLSVFGGREGSVWWDDVSIRDTPTLNWLQRDDLPQSLKAADGQPVDMSSNLLPIVDSQLGRAGFEGNFGNYQNPPVPVLANNATQLSDGDTVLLSGYHTQVTHRGQVSCSWNNPEIYERMRQVHEWVYTNIPPDGVSLNYDEIRNGGYEPADTQYTNSGAALSASIQRALSDLQQIAPGDKHLFWSDMIDPFHNARGFFYQVNGTLTGSWEGLNTDQIILMTWWEGEKIVKDGANSLGFFADLGFQQIIGGFYDADVQTNFDQWANARQSVPGIIGSMYATWRKDYSKIEAFGGLWW